MVPNFELHVAASISRASATLRGQNIAKKLKKRIFSTFSTLFLLITQVKNGQ
jgi:hypothetical protein